MHYRIQQFLDEQDHKGVYQDFDIAAEIEDFMRDVVYSYVMEHGSGRVQIELGRLDPAVVGGNLPRFRRMLFNLVMNAVDAMSHRDAGVVTVSTTLESDRVVLTTRDNGVGMPPEKITQLLTDRETLDGELHSLGFVFVRQTVREFGADLSIESAVGQGTTITVRFPCVSGKEVASPSTVQRQGGPPGSAPHRATQRPAIGLPMPSASAPVTPEDLTGVHGPAPVAPVAPAAASAPTPAGEARRFGRIVLRDYEVCEAAVPRRDLRDVGHRPGRGGLLRARSVRAVRGHRTREALAHVLRGGRPRADGAGRGEEAGHHV